MNSFRCLNVENWTGNDCLDWAIYTAEECKLNVSLRVLIHFFYQTGPELLALSEDEFCRRIDRNEGPNFYRLFQECVRNPPSDSPGGGSLPSSLSLQDSKPCSPFILKRLQNAETLDIEFDSCVKQMRSLILKDIIEAEREPRKIRKFTTYLLDRYYEEEGEEEEKKSRRLRKLTTYIMDKYREEKSEKKPSQFRKLTTYILDKYNENKANELWQIGKPAIHTEVTNENCKTCQNRNAQDNIVPCQSSDILNMSLNATWNKSDLYHPYQHTDTSLCTLKMLDNYSVSENPPFLLDIQEDSKERRTENQSKDDFPTGSPSASSVASDHPQSISYTIGKLDPELDFWQTQNPNMNIKKTWAEHKPFHNRSGGEEGDAKKKEPWKIRKMSSKRKDRTRSVKVWEYLLLLLSDPRYNPTLIKWISEKEGIFRLIKKEEIARLWGNRKQKGRRVEGDLTPNNFSRALRTYYGKGVLSPVSRNHEYKFSLGVMELYRSTSI